MDGGQKSKEAEGKIQLIILKNQTFNVFVYTVLNQDL